MKKKRYFSRGVMFLLCLIFAVMFLMPTVLTITNSFMSEAEINANYGMVFSTTTGGYVSKTVNLKFIPDKVTLSQYIDGLIKSPEYLLKDYMAENDSIFNADPKAIPYVVADYARTARNVVMRLCLRMSTGMVSESELCRELMLIDADTEHPWESFWHQVCMVNSPVGVLMHGKDGSEVLVRHVGSRELVFGPDTVSRKRKFSMKTGQMETLYFISDNNFKRALLSELQNAGYIAED